MTQTPVRPLFSTQSVEQRLASPGLAGDGSPLTEREWEVLDLVAEGCSNRQVGRRLGISEKTVKNHLHSIFGKLGTHSRTEAALVVYLRHMDSWRACGCPKSHRIADPR